MDNFHHSNDFNRRRVIKFALAVSRREGQLRIVRNRFYHSYVKYRDNNASLELRPRLYWTNIDRSTVWWPRVAFISRARVNMTKKSDLGVRRRRGITLPSRLPSCCRWGGPLHGVGSAFGRRSEIPHPAGDCVWRGERRAVRGRDRPGTWLPADPQDHPSRH